MAQWVKTLVTKSEDLSLILDPQGGENLFFQIVLSPSHMYIYIHKQM